MDKQKKYDFLRDFDFSTGKFMALISDYGLSTFRVPGDVSEQSVAGTPLYTPPQLLKRQPYTYKVDVWAIGIMCFEMLQGRTPFHAYEMKDLIRKITLGRFDITLDEQITIEGALFLT